MCIIGGFSIFTNSVKAPDIHFSSSQFCKQHLRCQRSVSCESNLARVLLFSTIGILLTLLFIFFLCSIIQICYKKRQSSNRTCSSVVVKSTVSKQDNPVSKSLPPSPIK
ncbi:unnamed protein product [Schistosoma curassoni]|uniref:Transmembrane protein 179B n=1 Tax=Schistosoma curassoni TaxID=6186 RepID=A0A183L6I1_9TREM|nr:unnamed protein product [Schistosoma curassoni]